VKTFLIADTRGFVMRKSLPILITGMFLMNFIIGCVSSTKTSQRFGMVIGLKPEKIEYYKQLHANCWPGVLKQITESNINNYSIYLKEIEPGKYYLFSYFEYDGDNFERDMKKLAANSEAKRFWKETDPCQNPIVTASEGEWWSQMEEVFYQP
jgi:L-rhamnose mutarotase